MSDNAVHVDITRKLLFSLKCTKNLYNLGDHETSGVVSVVLGDQRPPLGGTSAYKFNLVRVETGISVHIVLRLYVFTHPE